MLCGEGMGGKNQLRAARQTAAMARRRTGEKILKSQGWGILDSSFQVKRGRSRSLGLTPGQNERFGHQKFTHYLKQKLRPFKRLFCVFYLHHFNVIDKIISNG